MYRKQRKEKAEIKTVGRKRSRSTTQDGADAASNAAVSHIAVPCFHLLALFKLLDKQLAPGQDISKAMQQPYGPGIMHQSSMILQFDESDWQPDQDSLSKDAADDDADRDDMEQSSEAEPAALKSSRAQVSFHVAKVLKVLCLLAC